MIRTGSCGVYAVLGAVFLAVFAAGSADAANRYWVATSPGSWNDTANWGSYIGDLAGGASVPGPSDVAHFLGQSGTCLMNVNVNIAGLTIADSFTGTITQVPGVTVTIGSTGYSQAGGTFHGGDSAIQIAAGDFGVTGGTFVSTSGTLTQTTATGGGVTWTVGPAATFNHNGGEVRWGSGGGSTSRNVTGSCTLNHLRVQPSDYSTHSHALTVNAGTVIAVDSLLTLGGKGSTAGGGEIHAKGDIVQLDHAGLGGRMPVVINGTGDQSFTGLTTANRAMPDIRIDKLSGTLTFSGAIGAFNVNWEYMQGDINPGDSKIHFGVGNGQARTITGSHTLGDIIVDVRPGGGGSASITVAAGSVLTARDIIFDTTGGGGRTLNGAFRASGDIRILNSTSGGNAVLRLIGGEDQTIEQTGTNTGPRGSWTIDKSSGKVTLLSDLSLNVTGQSLYVESGTLDLDTHSLTVNNEFALGHGCTLRWPGGLTLNKAPALGTGTTIVYTGDIACLVEPWSYHNLSLEGAGPYSLDAPLALSGDWSKSEAAGFDPDGNAVTLTGADQTISGSTTFADLTKVVTEASTLTFEAGSRQTVTGALMLKGPGSAEEAAEADTSVQGGSGADTNFGSDATLMVRNDADIDNWHESYLRFDVSRYSSIAAATLWLYPEAVGLAHTQECRPVTEEWDELEVTYNTRPAVGDPIDSWTPQTGVPIEIDVTALAQTAVLDGGKVSVCIRGVTEGPDAWASYSSREASDAGRRPHLVIDGKGGATSLSLRSTEPGVRWEIDPQGARDIEHLDVQDSHNVNATRIDAFWKSVVNSGRNIGWTFETPYIEVTQHAGTFAAGPGPGTVIEVELWDGAGDLIGTDNSTRITFTPVGAAAAEIDGAGGVGEALTVTASGGTASISIFGELAESFHIVITNDGGYDNPPDEPVTVVAAAPHEVRVNIAPEDFPAGGGTAIEVYTYDQYGNHCLADGATEITFDSDYLRFDDGEAGEAAVVSVEGGVVSIAISSTVAGSHTLTISSALDDPDPIEITVFHGLGALLVTTVHPEDFTAGGSTTMTVELHDAYGNKVLDEVVELTFSFADTDTAEFTYGDGPGQAMAVAMVDGEATVTIENAKAETFEIHIANDASLDGPSPNPESVTVTHAAPAAVAVTVEPEHFIHGTSTVMRLEIQDAYGNRCLADNATELTFELSPEASAVLGPGVVGSEVSDPPLVMRAEAGEIELTIDNDVVEEFTISWSGFGAPGERTIWSYQGEPVQVVVTVEPEDFVAGESTILTVQLQTAEGDLCAHDSQTEVTFTPSSAGRVNGGVLGQPATVAATAGQITVTITSTLAQPSLTVSVSSDLATNPGPQAMAVTHAGPAKVAVTRTPSNFAAYGSTSMRVAVRDEFDNHCTNNSSTEITFSTNTGSKTRLGAVTGTVVAGAGGEGEELTVRAAMGVVEITIASDAREVFTLSTTSALPANPTDLTISVASFAGLGEGPGCAAGAGGNAGAITAALLVALLIGGLRRSASC